MLNLVQPPSAPTTGAPLLSDGAAYRAIQTHDTRFDGRLFVGVTSTRVYCRPVCRVRTPLMKHCRFFDTAARAEGAGFRPCRRCRPEIAPGLAMVDTPRSLAQHAAHMLQQAARDGRSPSMPQLAVRLGVTDRHLRRVFAQVHGVSPLAYLGTQRLLFAKHLLTDTVLPVTQVALLSGFGSLRRFNDAFATQYRLSPTALRRTSDAAPEADASSVSLRLAYRPPYDVDGVLSFFAKRALPGVETVDVNARCLRRTLQLENQGRWHGGWLEVRFDPSRDHVILKVASSLVPVIGRVTELVRRALDLDAQPDAIAAALRGLPVTVRAGLRLPGSIDGWESVVRIVLGQQITVAAARTLACRLLDTFGEPLKTPYEGLDRLFPSAQTLAQASAETIGRLGIVRTRVRAIQACAEALLSKQVDLDPPAVLDQTLATLGALPGFGEWTLQLVALRVLAWPDAFAASDVGVLRALGMERAVDAKALAVAWKPWRSYALVQLWQSLETGT